MQPHEIKHSIEEQLSNEAMAFWNGCDAGTVNEIVQYAQSVGVSGAVEEVEELALAPYGV